MPSKALPNIEADLPEDHANRVVDDLTRLLLRAYDASQSRRAA